MKRWAMMAAGLVLAGAAACTESGSPGLTPGSTQVLLTDAPFPYDDVSKVEVHIVRIEASTSSDTMGGSQDWVTIAAPNQAFDLLQLTAGATALAGTVDLEAGTYRAIRVTINTNLSKVTMADHSIAPVTWPVNGELVMNTLVQYPLEVAEGGSKIVIDFDVGRSFLPNFSVGFTFSAVIRAVNDAVTGTISGTVTDGGAAVQNASVSAYRGPAGCPMCWWEVTSARTDAQGHYTIGFLPGGLDYHLYGLAPHSSASAFATGVAVQQGQTTTRNLALVDDPTPPGPDSIPVPPDSGSGPATGPVAIVTVTPPSQTRSVGDSVGVYANLVNAQGQMLNGRAVTFTTSNAAIVSITGAYGQSALLKTHAVGEVTITATSEGKQGTARVVVQ